MSVSIYYTARRQQSLTANEQQGIGSLITEYSVEKEIEKYYQTGEGYNWESFGVYDLENSAESDIIFEGSTKLPDNLENAIVEGIQHWILLLSAIRCVIPSAEWHVHVDDYDLVWNDKISGYCF